MDKNAALALLSLCELLAWHIARLDGSDSVNAEINGAVQDAREAIYALAAAREGQP